MTIDMLVTYQSNARVLTMKPIATLMGSTQECTTLMQNCQSADTQLRSVTDKTSGDIGQV